MQIIKKYLRFFDLADLLICLILIFLIYILTSYLYKKFTKFYDVIYFYLIFSTINYLFFYLGKFFGYFNNYNIFIFSDTFADLVKLSLSYTNIFNNDLLMQLNVPIEWIEYNPYSLFVAENILYGYQNTPFYIIISQLIGFFISYFKFGYFIFSISVLALNLIIFLFFIYKNYKYEKKKFLYVFFLFSYPILFMVQRGNIYALILPMLIYSILQKFINSQQLDRFDIFKIVLIGCIRPNLLIFFLLFLYKTSFKESFRKIFEFLFMYISFNSLFLYFASNLYEGYSFTNFLYGLNEYSRAHLVGDSYDSSTFSSVLNILNNEIVDSIFIYSHYEKFINIQFSITLIYIIYLIYLTLKASKNKIGRMHFIVSIAVVSIAATSPIADYHLILFLIILLLLVNSSFKQNKSYIIIISLLLLPKPHAILLDFFNYSLVLNNILLHYLFFIGKKSKMEKKFEISQ